MLKKLKKASVKIIKRLYKVVKKLPKPARKIIGKFVPKTIKKLVIKKNDKKKQYNSIDPIIVNHSDIFDHKNGLEKLVLVGRNWTKDNAEEIPIVIIWGVKKRLWGSLAKYLTDYNIAFVPTKKSVVATIKVFTIYYNLKITPSTFFVWGKRDNILLRLWSYIYNIPLQSIEDGFIRSAALGINSIPYSLTFDDVPHYIQNKKSTILGLLNTYNPEEQELKKASNAISLIKNLKISKYNLPSSELLDHPIDISFIQKKKKVLVIQQVPKDLSLKYSNPDKWTNDSILDMVVKENPRAEIFCRAHPFSKDKLHKNYKGVHFVNSNINIHDVLDNVDHVYTICSLTGMDALIKGKKVTVLGTPFYAGWGLTDDRAKLKFRNRQLSLEELFFIAYLKYPKYLANFEDPYHGLISTCYKIDAERRQMLSDYFDQLEITSLEDVRKIAYSDYWIKLLLKQQVSPTIPEYKKFRQIPFSLIFLKLESPKSALFLAYLISGFLMHCERSLRYFLKSVQRFLDPLEFNALTIKVHEMTHNKHLCYEHFLEMLSKNSEDFDLMDSIVYDKIKADKKAEQQIYSPGDLALLMQLMEKHFQVTKDYTKVLEIAKVLLIHKHSVDKVLSMSAQAMFFSFNFLCSADLALLLYCFNYKTNFKSLAVVLNSFTPSQNSNSFTNLSALVMNSLPSNALNILYKYNLYKPDLEFDISQFILGMTNLYTHDSYYKVHAYLQLEEFELAVLELEAKSLKGNTLDYKEIVAFSMALSYCNRVDEAISVIKQSMKKYINNPMLYKELIRLRILSNDYLTAINELHEATKAKIDIGDSLARKIYFGNRMINSAFAEFPKDTASKLIKTFFSHKYFDVINHCNESDSILILACFGPGDEIRWASTYNDFRKIFKTQELTITCDPRLHNMFSRSFPDIKFIAVARKRTITTDSSEITNTHSQIKSIELISMLDNKAVEAIHNVNKICLTSTFLHEVLKDYNSFHGKSYLNADKELVDKIEKDYLLQYRGNGKKLVGISWRSSLNTFSRNEHYLAIEELAPIFALEGVQYVNLQYDKCSDELAWVEKNFPGKMIDIEEIDQYNDFESVSALMKCMDLIIAPATTVIELAGSLGCNSLLLTNSSEMHWRKIDKAGMDVWHNSTIHVESDDVGDKISLVKNLYKKLKTLIN